MSSDLSSLMDPKTILSGSVNYLKKSVTDPKTALTTFMSPAMAPLTSMLNDQSKVQAPALSTPTIMPVPDDQAVQQAKRRSIAAQMARRGRASTILTDSQSSGETLGG
jgi:hypothetical protein